MDPVPQLQTPEQIAADDQWFEEKGQLLLDFLQKRGFTITAFHKGSLIADDSLESDGPYIEFRGGEAPDLARQQVSNLLAWWKAFYENHKPDVEEARLVLSRPVGPDNVFTLASQGAWGIPRRRKDFRQLFVRQSRAEFVKFANSLR